MSKPRYYKCPMCHSWEVLGFGDYYNGILICDNCYEKVTENNNY